MGKKEKKARTRDKKQRTGKKHSSIKVWEKYEVSGESANRKNKFCPRCGSGTFLSEQKNREYCGKCGYTNFKGGQKPDQKPPEVKEAPAEEPTEKRKEEAPAEEPKEEERPEGAE